ncbi:MAG: hypothetical protein HY927_11535 [Elusimicrobia bacterium]|nr:hypothetical protein [Elusimicrobiota bacterium]
MSKNRVGGAVSELSALGQVVRYVSAEVDFSELYFKLANLRAERALLLNDKSSIPAVLATVDSKVEYLESFASKHRDVIDDAAVGIVLTDSAHVAAPVVPASRSEEVATETQIAIGMPRTFCGKGGIVLSVFVRVKDLARAAAEAKGLFSMDGALELAANCSDGGMRPPGWYKKPFPYIWLAGWFKEGFLAEAKSRLSAIGEVVGTNDGSSFGGPPQDADEHLRALQAEISSHDGLLRTTPHVLTLLQDELRWLEPAAKARRDTADRALMQVFLFDDMLNQGPTP